MSNIIIRYVNELIELGIIDYSSVGFDYLYDSYKESLQTLTRANLVSYTQAVNIKSSDLSVLTKQLREKIKDDCKTLSDEILNLKFSSLNLESSAKLGNLRTHAKKLLFLTGMISPDELYTSFLESVELSNKTPLLYLERLRSYNHFISTCHEIFTEKVQEIFKISLGYFESIVEHLSENDNIEEISQEVVTQLSVLQGNMRFLKSLCEN